MSWLQRVFRGRIDSRADLDREIAFHLAEETRLRAERGDPPERARFEARRAFGNAMRVREQVDRLNPSGIVAEIWRDLKYGARLLRGAPGFTAVAILSLALGIGANTSIFQLLDAVRLRTLPVKDPAELAEVRVANANDGRSGNFTGARPELTNPLWERIRAGQQGFSRILAWGATSFETASGGESQRAQGLWVSGDFFGTLEIEPVLGRVINTADDVRGCGAPGAVLNHAFWQRRYGGDRHIVGQSIRLDGQLFPIIGVAPPGFYGVDVGTTFDVALPICAERLTRGDRSRLEVRRAWWLAAIGRLKPGWSMDRASAQLDAISPGIFAATVEPTYIPRSAKQYLEFRLGAFPAATGVSNLREDYETPLWLLLAISGLVLLIACANLANLMLARATAREREIAVRLAIGASRGRIIRQLLAESLLLAACGSALGAILSQALSTFLVSLFGDAVVIDLRADGHVLGVTASLAVGACVLFGLAPAVRATRVAPASVIKAGARGSTGGRESFGLRRALVVVQVALSLVLVVGALLFVRTLQNLMAVDPGFRQDGLLVTTLDFRETGVAEPEQGPLHRDLLERVTRVPGVQAAASVFIPPISGGGWWNETILVDGVVQRAAPNLNWISDGFFKAMETPILAGRDFDEHDLLSAPPVAIVNESFARVFFGAQRPLGRTFQIETGPGEARPDFQIVGLVRDTKYDHVREPFGPIAFFPMGQNPRPGASDRIVIRSNLPLPALVSSVKRAVAEANPNILIRFETLASQVEKSLLRERLMATLSGFFGALAGLLATIGLYGVMSYMVARRRNEIGIRMALGADRALVVRLVLREAIVLLGAGTIVGLVLAAAAARATASLLFGLQPGDPATLAAAVAVLGAVGVLASYLPARRASRLEPTVVLREE
jgi:putative ABC transport system permease protein